MKKSLALLTVLFLASSIGFTFAQDANGNNPGMSPKARLIRQHARIKEGVKDGSISPKEHRQLARQGRRINRERRRDLRKDGGKLNDADRAKLERQENFRSGEIAADKHN